jgi:hypothetical protein
MRDEEGEETSRIPKKSERVIRDDTHLLDGDSSYPVQSSGRQRWKENTTTFMTDWQFAILFAVEILLVFGIALDASEHVEGGLTFCIFVTQELAPSFPGGNDWFLAGQQAGGFMWGSACVSVAVSAAWVVLYFSTFKQRLIHLSQVDAVYRK